VYLLNGDESLLDPSYPVTDAGYFGATINMYGKLTGVPDAHRLSSFSGRKHLVIAELGNSALIRNSCFGTLLSGIS
jgi:hypothetical protein